MHHGMISFCTISVSRTDDFSVAGETESWSWGGEEVSGSHTGVRPNQGGEPFGPGCGGSTCQVKDYLSLLSTFPSLLQQQPRNSSIRSKLMMVSVFDTKGLTEWLVSRHLDGQQIHISVWLWRWSQKSKNVLKNLLPTLLCLDAP